MVREDIVTGLRNALERGGSMEQAKQSQNPFFKISSQTFSSIDASSIFQVNDMRQNTLVEYRAQDLFYDDDKLAGMSIADLRGVMYAAICEQLQQDKRVMRAFLPAEDT